MKECISGKVALVKDSNHRIILNKGRNDGVVKGMRFLIYRLGEEIIDPETNNSLGRLEIVCGEGVAEHVQDTMTTVMSVERKILHKRTITVQNGPFAVLQGAKKEIDEPEEQELPFRGVERGCLVKSIQ